MIFSGDIAAHQHQLVRVGQVLGRCVEVVILPNGSLRRGGSKEQSIVGETEVAERIGGGRVWEELIF